MSTRSGTLGALRGGERQNWILESVFGSSYRHRSLFRQRLEQVLKSIDTPDDTPAILLNVPGRIEVLGKHTDYAGGMSLTCGSSRSFLSIVTPHEEPTLIVRDAVRKDRIRIPYADPRPVAGYSWSRYVATVLARLIRHFGPPASGIEIVMSSDLPGASGMSSSSALVVTIAAAVLASTGFPSDVNFTRERFAGFAGALESGAAFENLKGDAGVGTKGGSEDHTAILCSKEGTLGLYSYFPVTEIDSIPVPENLIFVIGSSGVKASKTGNARKKYNLASDRASKVLSLWNASANAGHLSLGHMMDSPEFDRDVLRDILRSQVDGGELWNRFMQFDRESTVVIPSAMKAVAAGNWDSFGKFVDESQQMAHKWLGNQVGETRFLAKSAREIGAYAASSFGAGFGGAVWALVPESKAEEFTSSWINAYTLRFPQRMSAARFFTDIPSRGVFIYGTTIPGW